MPQKAKTRQNSNNKCAAPYRHYINYVHGFLFLSKSQVGLLPRAASRHQRSLISSPNEEDDDGDDGDDDDDDDDDDD